MANTGDSRALIVRPKSALPLTVDADPKTSKDEADRIEGCAGCEIDDLGYINDTVNMSRCMGDRKGKFYIKEK